MNILITGGAGFIGSALIRYLIENTSHGVLNLDKLTYAGNLASLTSVCQSSRYFFEQADICNKEAVQQIFNRFQPDAVMHLAAESHVDKSIYQSQAFIETNIIGSWVMLETSRLYWEQLPANRKAAFRFHHISTDEVYGSLDFNPENRFHETTAYAPGSPYSASKASADHLVRAWHNTWKLPVLITNCSNNYGPYQFPEKLIPLTILNALQGKTIPVYGSGLQVRDWLYVGDHVEALYQVLTKGKPGETWNIGGNCEKTNLDLIQTLCALLESIKPDKPRGLASYASLIKHVEDRKGHDQRYAINCEKIYSELGWQPQTRFEEGLKKTICWYLDNPGWAESTCDKKWQLATTF